MNNDTDAAQPSTEDHDSFDLRPACRYGQGSQCGGGKLYGGQSAMARLNGVCMNTDWCDGFQTQDYGIAVVLNGYHER